MTEMIKMTESEGLKQQAAALKLYGLTAHWHEVSEEQTHWLAQWLAWERSERQQRMIKAGPKNFKYFGIL